MCDFLQKQFQEAFSRTHELIIDWRDVVTVCDSHDDRSY